MGSLIEDATYNLALDPDRRVFVLVARRGPSFWDTVEEQRDEDKPASRGVLLLPPVPGTYTPCVALPPIRILTRL
jgi:hypothetical protein